MGLSWGDPEHRLPPHAALLEQSVRLPPGHPEGWTGYPDSTDELLSQLHDELWPREEWAAVEVCPHLRLEPYETRNVARGALRRVRREHGRLRHALWRVWECPCGWWHTGPRGDRAV